MGGSFRTDLGAQGALSLAGKLRGMDASAVRGALVPGQELQGDGASLYAASSDAWSTMMERVEAGEDPAVADEAPERRSRQLHDHRAQRLRHHRGGGRSLRERSKAGVSRSSRRANTDVYAAYDETLVVYNDDAYEAAAQTVVDALGFGRTVAGNGFYTFESDVLVVLGEDWKPTA